MSGRTGVRSRSPEGRRGSIRPEGIRSFCLLSCRRGIGARSPPCRRTMRPRRVRPREPSVSQESGADERLPRPAPRRLELQRGRRPTLEQCPPQQHGVPSRRSGTHQSEGSLRRGSWRRPRRTRSLGHAVRRGRPRERSPRLRARPWGVGAACAKSKYNRRPRSSKRSLEAGPERAEPPLM